MSRSRVKNTVRNSMAGMGSYLLSSLLSFVSRTVFIHTLGVEYLGVSGLFSNVLSVLALSDLGLFTVMVYSLYKPIAEDDTKKIATLINYYQKLYLIVAAVIALLGIACVPFLQFIAKDSGFSQKNLILYYLLILANSVCSYLVICKTTLIRADQQVHIIQIVGSITNVLQHTLQIIVMVVFKSFVIYLTLPIACTVLNNLLLNRIANKRYPYLKTVDTSTSVDAQLMLDLKANLKSTFLYKLGATIINSTDNILISVLLGTVTVGYYSNYATIIALVNSLVSIFIRGVLDSIGNFNATQSSERKFQLFKTILCVFYLIAGFCAACYLSIFNDFITLWIGPEYVLDRVFLIALVINCTVTCISNPIWMLRESSGLFQSTRYVMLCAAALNILISIALAQLIGLAGIILGTAAAHLLTLFWYEPRQLCKRLFHIPTINYWKYIARLFTAILPCTALGWILQSFPTTNIFLILGKVALCGITTFLSFLLFIGKTEEMRWIFHILSHSFKKNKD